MFERLGRPSVRPSVRSPVRPEPGPSVRPSARPSVRPPVRPSVRPQIRVGGEGEARVTAPDLTLGSKFWVWSGPWVNDADPRVKRGQLEVKILGRFCGLA